jgi:hypothetical protein
MIKIFSYLKDHYSLSSIKFNFKVHIADFLKRSKNIITGDDRTTKQTQFSEKHD